jgi:hypothetical protein
MRCPRCLDEYEPHVRTCAACGLELVSADHPLPHPPAAVDAHLGVFDEEVAEAVMGLLADRDVAAETVTRDSGIAVLTERAWRDDLRAELTMTWPELLRRLPEEQAVAVRARGGQHPGWLDPPRGGWVDRQGRMVVEVADEADEARVVGPAMAVGGGVLLVLAWYAGLGPGLVVAGIALALVGLLLPR